MKRAIACAALIGLAAAPLFAGPRGSVTGEYVEARTAEVFTGGCTMGSEAETAGQHAILAWRVDRGVLDGVSLDGLAVVAAVAGDRNLGIREIGGVASTTVRAAVLVDERADAAQRNALVALVRALSSGLVTDIVDVRAAPVRFAGDGSTIRVSAGDAELAVQTHLTHDPSCGAMQWFRPLTSVADATIGLASAHAFSGDALGTKWSDPGKKSAFVGTFSY